ncbi:MAG: hypothetical protein H0W88_12245 [Parachlamydiaceae bacterium]|nr:hypothetical protein [Parachlamydiaceae bacterium]
MFSDGGFYNVDNYNRPVDIFYYTKPKNFVGFLKESLQRIKDIWQGTKKGYEQTHNIRKCVIVKTIGLTGAEIVGASIGQKVAIGAISEIIVPVALPFVIAHLVNTGAKTTYSVMSKATLKTRMIYGMIIASGAVIVIMNSEQIYTYLDSTSSFLINQVGGMAGRILGGFLGLKFMNSNITFWGESPWNSYSASMARHQTVGALFEGSVKDLGVVGNFPLGVIKFVTQTSAYNSNLIVGHFKDLSKNQNSTDSTEKKGFMNLAIQMGLNRLNKRDPYLFSTKRKRILTPLETLLSEVIEITNQKKIVGISYFAPVSANLIGNAFLQYTNFLNKHSETRQALKEFKASFSNPPKAASKIPATQIPIDPKNNLTKAIADKLKEDSFYTVSNFIVRAVLGDIKTLKLTSDLIKAIQELETELFGLTLLRKNNAAYLNEILSIHLKYFLIFTLMNMHKFSKTPVNEKELLLCINDTILHEYLSNVLPRAVADSFNAVTGFTIRGTFLVTNTFLRLVRQPRRAVMFVEKTEIHELVHSLSKEELERAREEQEDFIFIKYSLTPEEAAAEAAEAAKDRQEWDFTTDEDLRDYTEAEVAETGNKDASAKEIKEENKKFKEENKVKTDKKEPQEEKRDHKIDN